jgi:hypothetical protein
MAVMNFCPSCGSPQAAGANFCVGCGYKLDSINVPSPPSDAAPVPGTTQSIGNAIGDQVAIYDHKMASSLSRITDSDQQFAACMQTKGFTVPAGIWPKVKAMMPFAQEKAVNIGRDTGIEATLEAAMEEALDATFMAGMEGLAVGMEIYDHAALGAAALDCAIRVHAGEQWEPAPGPITPPAVPVLPPPPPNWQPLVVPMSEPPPPPNWQPPVIPMEDPLPALAPAVKTGWSVGQALLFIFVMIPIVIGAIWIGDNYFWNSPSGGSWYEHYNCRGDQTCQSLMGGYDLGIRIGPVSTQAECNYDSGANRNFIIDNGGQIWCDQSSDPSETS